MNITRIDLFKSSIPLRKPFIISLGKLERAANIIVRIHTDAGLTGFGECSPFPTIHGETMESCFIAGQYLAPALIGWNPLDIEHRIRQLNAMLFGNACIKSAFDMALFDIAAKQAGLPLYKFLGGKAKKKLVTDYTVSIGLPKKMADDARQIAADGFRVIKVKLGGSVNDDVERIRKIREAVPGLTLRIDANQGWTPEDAVKILVALEPFGIQHCEEPINRRDFLQLPGIRAKSPIPIMADESCFDASDAEKLIALEACDLLNIKTGKSGIHGAMEIHRMASDAGMNLQAGGFLESRLGFTAAAHVALACDNIIHIDFDTPLMFSEDPVTGGIIYGAHGEITVPDAPGIGAALKEEYLDALVQASVSA